MQMRIENVDLMRKTFWGGGTVALAASSNDFHVLKCRPSDKFEDGTLPFLDIIALQHGFDFIERSLGGVERIRDHVHALTHAAYDRIAGLRHGNGAPVAKVFGNHEHADPEATQGAIINFEVLDVEGNEVSYRYVERAAAEAGFHIRAGAELFCLAAAVQRIAGLTGCPCPATACFCGLVLCFICNVLSGSLEHKQVWAACCVLASRL